MHYEDVEDQNLQFSTFKIFAMLRHISLKLQDMSILNIVNIFH